MASRRSGASAAYVVVYTVALLLGRLAVTNSGGVVFFWPAAGVAALWLLSGRTRARVLCDAALLLTVTLVADVIMGVDLGPALLYAVANLLVGLVVRASSARLEHQSFWGPLPRRMASPRDLTAVGATSV